MMKQIEYYDVKGERGEPLGHIKYNPNEELPYTPIIFRGIGKAKTYDEAVQMIRDER